MTTGASGPGIERTSVQRGVDATVAAYSLASVTPS